MPNNVQLLLEPERPEEPGLDLIVVHGVTTLGLPPLPPNWHLSLLRIAPENTRIIGYDADLRVDKGFRWKDIEARSDALLDSMWSRWTGTPSGRAFVFIGVGLAGCIVKQTLYRFSQEHRYLSCLARTKGVIFFATPHFTSSDNHTAATLTGILRYRGYTSSRALFAKYDLSSMVESSWGFEELKLACPILSCYEQIPLKPRGLFSLGRSVTLVDEEMCSMVVRDHNMVPIDTCLTNLFDSVDFGVHEHVGGFLQGVATNTLYLEEECTDRSLDTSIESLSSSTQQIINAQGGFPFPGAHLPMFPPVMDTPSQPAFINWPPVTFGSHAGSSVDLSYSNPPTPPYFINGVSPLSSHLVVPAPRYILVSDQHECITCSSRRNPDLTQLEDPAVYVQSELEIGAA